MTPRRRPNTATHRGPQRPQSSLLGSARAGADVGLLLLALLLAGLIALSLAPTGRAAAPAQPLGTPSPQAYLPMIYQWPTPTPTVTPPPVTPPSSGDWRVVLGYYRAAGRLPGLSQNTGWSDGAFKHAKYMVMNQTAANYETPGLWYTAEGAAAAPNSLLQLQGDVNFSDRRALDQWMQWPFHASAMEQTVTG